MAMGWQRGIRFGVHLAAMIPATRATARTSPFFIRFSRNSSRAAPSENLTVHAAVATRDVVAFSEMETIRADPDAVTCVRSGAGFASSDRLPWSDEKGRS